MIIDGEDDEYSDEDAEDAPSIGAAPIKTALPPRSAAILPAVAPATPAAALKASRCVPIIRIVSASARAHHNPHQHNTAAAR